MPNPTFLYIGVAKAGSSWMYEILREHPDVFVPPAKDIYFFDRHYARGLDWYRSFFAPGATKKATGELSHDYYLSPAVAGRIAHDLPGVRLFCCVREPVDWAISSYGYNQTTEVKAHITFEQYLKRPEIIPQIEYASRFRPFFDRFPRSNLKVLFFDDLKTDPAKFAREIFEFIGIDPNFKPALLHTKVNAAHKARSQFLTQTAYRIGGILRATGAANIVGAIKRHPITEKLLYRPRAQKPFIDPKVAVRLRETVADELTQFQRLIDRPLPSGWLQSEEKAAP